MCIDTSTAGLERAWAGSPCLRARGGSTCAGCVCSAAGWATRSTTSPNLVALTSVAARLGRARSPKEYAELARELQFPSLPTVLNPMGGWTSAIRAAGMRPLGEAKRRTRARHWTDDACWAALRRSSPSWARSRPSSPTSATPPLARTCRRRPRCAIVSVAGAPSRRGWRPSRRSAVHAQRAGQLSPLAELGARR